MKEENKGNNSINIGQLKEKKRKNREFECELERNLGNYNDQEKNKRRNKRKSMKKMMRMIVMVGMRKLAVEMKDERRRDREARG
jgi:hypothetical protein